MFRRRIARGPNFVFRLLLRERPASVGLVPFLKRKSTKKNFSTFVNLVWIKKIHAKNSKIKCWNMEKAKGFWPDKKKNSSIFQNARPFQKFYAPEMQKRASHRRSKLVSTESAPRAANRLTAALGAFSDSGRGLFSLVLMLGLSMIPWWSW